MQAIYFYPYDNFCMILGPPRNNSLHIKKSKLNKACAVFAFWSHHLLLKV